MPKPILGIIGGGQLGSLLVDAAKKLEIKTIIFCDDKDAPAQKFSNEFIFGDYNDSIKIKEFIDKVDIITFEFDPPVVNNGTKIRYASISLFTLILILIAYKNKLNRNLK